MGWSWLAQNAGEIIAAGIAVVGIWRAKGSSKRKALETARELNQAARELALWRAEAAWYRGFKEVAAEADTVPDFVEEMTRRIEGAKL